MERRPGSLVASLVTLALAAVVPAGAGAQEGDVPPAPSRATEAGADSARQVTLEEAIAMAQRQSPVLREASRNVSAARAGRTGAYGSFLPTVDLGYGFSESSTARLDPTQQALTRQSFTGQLTGRITLFDGFRRFDELESARTTVQAREATYEQRRFETILNVKTSFYNAVAAQDRVEVERARVQRQLDQLDFIRQRIAQGQATRSDSLNTRVELNNARLAVMNARNDARQATYALAEAMGVEERVRPVAGATLDPDTLHLGRDQLFRVAEERAPELRSARLSADAARSSADAERSAYLPSLSLSGGWDWQEGNFPPGNRSWSYRLSGSIPLFNGLQRETSIARAESQADAALARVQQTRLAIRRNVDDAYSQMETALSGLRLAEETVELAREDLRVTQQRYRLGVATILDLQDRQIALAEAEVDVIRRKFDYQVATARLESIIGTRIEALEAGAAGNGRSASGTRATQPQETETR